MYFAKNMMDQMVTVLTAIQDSNWRRASVCVNDLTIILWLLYILAIYDSLRERKMGDEEMSWRDGW